jgi:hypothetical protein
MIWLMIWDRNEERERERERERNFHSRFRICLRSLLHQILSVVRISKTHRHIEMPFLFRSLDHSYFLSTQCILPWKSHLTRDFFVTSK